MLNSALTHSWNVAANFVLVTRLLLIALIFAGTLSSFAHEGDKKKTFSGTVIEQGTQEELTGVRVQVVGTDQIVYTDKDGHFEISGTNGSDVTLKFSFVSFEDQEQTISLKADEAVVELLPR